jgi:predicted enzyme related to lactoylglutathione lyase
MSDDAGVGVIGWIDLTVPEATTIRDFYKAVVGWKDKEVPMGDHSDYCMYPPSSDQPVAGICHARGLNADLPGQWLIYITVRDLEASAARAQALGGRILIGPRSLGDQGRFCVIQDPAGAVAALYAAAKRPA